LYLITDSKEAENIKSSAKESPNLEHCSVIKQETILKMCTKLVQQTVLEEPVKFE
jgi:hypothetical protein